MGIRIQPREIDVPKNDPFKNDLLGRKESVEVLTHLVGNFEGPCVLAVDAAWGNGKTTFLRIWAQHLRKEKFPVVEFNAWETDFSGDPFVALSAELTEGLHEYTDEPLATKIADTKKSGEGSSATNHSGCDSTGNCGRPGCRSTLGKGSGSGPRFLRHGQTVRIPGVAKNRSSHSGVPCKTWRRNCRCRRSALSL